MQVRQRDLAWLAPRFFPDFPKTLVMRLRNWQRTWLDKPLQVFSQPILATRRLEATRALAEGSHAWREGYDEGIATGMRPSAGNRGQLNATVKPAPIV